MAVIWSLVATAICLQARSAWPGPVPIARGVRLRLSISANLARWSVNVVPIVQANVAIFPEEMIRDNLCKLQAWRLAPLRGKQARESAGSDDWRLWCQWISVERQSGWLLSIAPYARLWSPMKTKPIVLGRDFAVYPCETMTMRLIRWKVWLALDRWLARNVRSSGCRIAPVFLNAQFSFYVIVIIHLAVACSNWTAAFESVERLQAPEIPHKHLGCSDDTFHRRADY